MPVSRRHITRINNNSPRVPIQTSAKQVSSRLCEIEKKVGNSLTARWLAYRVLLTAMILIPGCTLCLTTLHILNTYSIFFFCFLHYPFAAYFFLFGMKVHPFFFRLEPDLSREATKCSMNAATPSGHSLSAKGMVTTVRFCEIGPEQIRADVLKLKTDFNERISQVLFISFTMTYYTLILPLFIVPATINYSLNWCLHTTTAGFIVSTCLCCIVYLPPNYLDMLHRCAAHLGKWSRVGARNAHVPYQAWSELTVWRRDSLVKHVRGLFKATGAIENSAEPGNTSHSRFFFIFSSPLWLTSRILLSIIFTLLYEFYLMSAFRRWNQVLSLVFMIFYTQVALFIVLRSWFVLKACYVLDISKSA